MKPQPKTQKAKYVFRAETSLKRKKKKRKKNPHPGYLGFIRSKPCLSCGHPAEAHHCKSLHMGGMGMKPPDTVCLPLCRRCHVELHQKGEKRMFDTWNIDIKSEIIKLLTEFLKED